MNHSELIALYELLHKKAQSLGLLLSHYQGSFALYTQGNQRVQGCGSTIQEVDSFLKGIYFAKSQGPVNETLTKKADALHPTQTALSQAMQETEKLKRQQEIIADIGFGLGHWWAKQSVVQINKLHEGLGGSTGITTVVKDWAVEFDTFWEALPQEDERREDYIGQIDDFIYKKLDEDLLKKYGMGS